MDFSLAVVVCLWNYRTLSNRPPVVCTSIQNSATRGETAAHILARNVVAALFHSCCDSVQSHAHRGQSQEHHFNPITSGFPMFQSSDVSQPAQSAFEREVLPGFRQAVEFGKNQSVPLSTPPVLVSAATTQLPKGPRRQNVPAWLPSAEILGQTSFYLRHSARQLRGTTERSFKRTRNQFPVFNSTTSCGAASFMPAALTRMKRALVRSCSRFAAPR